MAGGQSRQGKGLSSVAQDWKRATSVNHAASERPNRARNELGSRVISNQRNCTRVRAFNTMCHDELNRIAEEVGSVGSRGTRENVAKVRQVAFLTIVNSVAEGQM